MSAPDLSPEAIDLGALARVLPQAWQSHVLGSVGASRLKLLRMDAQPYPEETHDYAEALLVLDGRLCLTVAGREQVVDAGGLYLMPAGVAHAVAEGSHGTLLIIDV